MSADHMQVRSNDPIPIGASVPRNGGRASRWFFQRVLRLLGWRITGSIADIPKMVMIGGPHTSNWDFVYGIFSIFALGIDAHWIGKHTIFRWPFGALLRCLGGIPVNRTSPGTLYREILKGFEENDSFFFGLSPEGTRAKVTRWKPGFHRIARAAGVPILPAALDFQKKEIHFGPIFEPTDDFEADVASLKAFYSNFVPKKPELF